MRKDHRFYFIVKVGRSEQILQGYMFARTIIGARKKIRKVLKKKGYKESEFKNFIITDVTK